ncbi:uracil-DNA glycosylase [Mycoplasma simbae]|uniref:uracil-DNA glycosylase n=1 Tax=Mycoplasma simbae TaxID=36744 RepID=UPI000496BBB6|nr:uracil-DNA glycosylase [Mycoplasma simbae]
MAKNSFQDFIQSQHNLDYFKKLQSFIDQDEQKYNIYPLKQHRYRTLSFFEPIDTKLIIIGQDPYHLPHQADGLAFSTHLDTPPRSLSNIIKEVKKDYPECLIQTYSLDSWAKQGVLLINTVLSVREKQPNSHANMGWEIFVANLIEFIINIKKDIVFGIWGNSAYQFIKPFIDKGLINPEQIIYCSHPSPLAYARTNKSFKDFGFFKKVNQKLDQNIDFSLRKE